MRIKFVDLIDSATLPYFEVRSSWHGYMLLFSTEALSAFLHALLVIFKATPFAFST